MRAEGFRGIQRTQGERLMDETACYRVGRGLEQCGIYRVVNPTWVIDMPRVPGAWEFGMGYRPYTGQWEIFDLESGERIGDVRRQFYAVLFRQFLVGSLDRPCEETG